MRMWQFSRFNESGFSCLSQPEPDKPATLMEYVLKDELVDARPRLLLGVSARVNSYDWSDDNLRLAIGCEDGTVCIHTRGTKDAGGGAGLQRVEVEGRQPVRARPTRAFTRQCFATRAAALTCGWGAVAGGAGEMASEECGVRRLPLQRRPAILRPGGPSPLPRRRSAVRNPDGADGQPPRLHRAASLCGLVPGGAQAGRAALAR